MEQKAEHGIDVRERKKQGPPEAVDTVPVNAMMFLATKRNVQNTA
jgi:hypothetical protein